jgi:hypothetical protein
LLLQQLVNSREKQKARNVPKAFVRIWKMCADITERGGTKQRITYGMEKDISIRMTKQSFVKRNCYSTQY